MNHNKAYFCLEQAMVCLKKNFANKVFICDGTLLGHVRNGGFIRGDGDIDLGIKREDYRPQIVEDMLTGGFKLLKTRGILDDGLEHTFQLDGVRLDIFIFYTENESIWTKAYTKLITAKYKWPHFDLKRTDFNGIETMQPSNPELYLIAGYGWRWREVAYRWQYKYCPPNMTILGAWPKRQLFEFRKAIWRWRNPDIYLPKSGIPPRIVYTDGVFDLFHANHVAFLQKAASYGDELVVGVVSDASARSYKRTPVIPEAERLRIVQSLTCVDRAFLYELQPINESLGKIIAENNISAVIYSGNATPEFYECAEAAGIMHRIPYRSGVSTSTIIEQLTETQVQEIEAYQHYP